MKTRNLTLSAIFMALGLVMHFLVPPIFGGVKPDFLLSMMFISLIIAGDIKEAILIGVCGGIMSALTTSFPGGQIPNFIEKIIVAIVIFILIQKFGKGLNKYQTVFIYALGTLLSGVLFLLLALGITKQMNLFLLSLPVVLVAMIVNSIFGLILMNAYRKIEKMI